MTIRTFTAASIQEATRLAVQELGRDAFILKIQPKDTKGLWRMLGRQKVVLHACGPADLPVTRRRPPAADMASQAPAVRVQRAYASGASAPAFPSSGLSAEVKALAEGMAEMKGVLQELSREGRERREPAPDVAESLQQLYRALVEREVSEGRARGLVKQVNEALRGEELKNPVLVRNQMRQSIEKLVRHAGPLQLGGDRARVVALVGPTGAGKTTTVAKLAAHFHWVRRKKVGLVTVDNYRMGAREQLQHYAAILNVPMEAASTPGEARQAVRRLAERDLVLVDTAGYSQRDALKSSEMKAFLAAMRPDETHLLLSCTTHPRVLRQVVDVYRTLPFDRVILTKLDEAATYGALLEVLQAAEKPLSYVTQGQEVREDIRLGDPSHIARLVLGEEA